MSIHQQIQDVCPKSDTALAIGTFDGVHVGHQSLFKQLLQEAFRSDLQTMVLTFRNHPRSILDPTSEVQYIMPWEERERCIKSLGIDTVVPLEFTPKIARLRAHDFVANLVSDLRMRVLVAGPDFALGHNREGDIGALKKWGADMDFQVSVANLETLGDRPASSRGIRNMISEGDVESATQMLGRFPTLTGLVVKGDRRGRELGFPTANIASEQGILVPCNGIYATWIILDGKRYPSATSIGVRPTFGSGARSVETFILNFDSEIYGEEVTLQFVSRLREELAFSTVDALVQQMHLDVEKAKEVLRKCDA